MGPKGPLRRSGKLTGTPDEKIADWLQRMDIPVEDRASIKAFKKYLEEEFSFYTDAQREALLGAFKADTTLEEHGINAVIVPYPWGKELRYGVQGMPGLWGWEAVQEIMSEEEE